MKRILFVCASALLLFSCVDPIEECATCYSIKKNLNSGAIEDKASVGTQCGNEKDSLELIDPTVLDNYEYSYICE